MALKERPKYDLKQSLLDTIRKFGQADADDSVPWAMIKGGLSGSAEAAADLFVPSYKDPIPAGVVPPVMGTFGPKRPLHMPSERRMGELMKKFGGRGPDPNLPMDEASRIARANEQGFTMPAYHATNAPEDFTEFNSPIRAGGYGDGDFGIHVTPRIETANKAAHVMDQQLLELSDNPNAASFAAGELMPEERHARIMPLRVNPGRTFEMPDAGIWRSPDSYNLNVAEAKTNDPELLQQIVDEAQRFADQQFRGMNDYVDIQHRWQHKLREMLQGRNYTSVAYPNHTEGRGELSYMLLDPRQVRSRFAAFDPSKLGSRDLLASLAAALGIPSLMDPEKP